MKMTYEQYRDEVMDAIRPEVLAHLRDGVADRLGLWQSWERGVSVNDAIVQQRYQDARAKADRSY